MKVSTRLTIVPVSPIRKLVPFALEAKKQGVRVYHLNIGDPDIETPEVMIKALQNWKKSPIGYDESQGNPVFIDALVSYYHGLGSSFIQSSHIQVSVGGSEAIAMALFATCAAGDRVLVFEPFYANYNSFAAVTGIQLVPVLTTIATGFHLPDRKRIEAKITKRTKAILFCNPNNPTGTVYTKREIDLLVAIANKYNLFLLSDEVYREYSYDGRKHISLFTYMQEIPDQAIVLDSMSKRYSLCGVRLGALVSLNTDIMAGVLRIAQGRLSAGLIDQVVAAQLTKVSRAWLKKTHDEFEKRRDVVYEGLKKISGVTIPKPEGAFYTIVKLPVTDSEDFCQWLLTDFRDPSASSGQGETVMLAPAAGFYSTKGLGKNEVRIAYVLNQKALKRCIEILKRALTQYNTRRHKKIRKSSPQKKKLILFDIDGTLIHHVGGQMTVWWPRIIYALNKVFGVDVQIDTSGRYMGMIDRQISWELVRTQGITKKEFDKKFPLVGNFLLKFARGQEKRAIPLYTPIADAVTLAKKLLAHEDFRIGLLTGNVERMGWWKLQHAGITNLFSWGLFGDEADDKPMLARTIIVTVKDHFGIEFLPRDIFVIGDSTYDIRSAKSIGAKSIAVATGGHSPEDLEIEHPDLLVDSLMDKRVFALLGLKKPLL